MAKKKTEMPEDIWIPRNQPKCKEYGFDVFYVPVHFDNEHLSTGGECPFYFNYMEGWGLASDLGLYYLNVVERNLPEPPVYVIPVACCLPEYWWTEQIFLLKPELIIHGLPDIEKNYEIIYEAVKNHDQSTCNKCIIYNALTIT